MPLKLAHSGCHAGAVSDGVAVKDGRQIDLRPQLFDLERKTADHEFLFGPNVAQFIDEIYEKGRQLYTHAGHAMFSFDPSLESLTPSSTALEQAQRKFKLEHAQAETEVLAWFADQLRKAQEIFLPYMDFTKP